MRESRLSGSVEGVMSNRDPYSDWADFTSGCKLLTVFIRYLRKAFTTKGTKIREGRSTALLFMLNPLRQFCSRDCILFTGS